MPGTGAGDLGRSGGARSELERLLATNNRDPQLLKQLSKLAEEEGDVESAGRYQKQLIELAPSDEELSRLAQLYARVGEIEDAQAVWSKIGCRQEQDTPRLPGDRQLARRISKAQTALEITEAMLRRDPSDWEARYREGAARWPRQNPRAPNGSTACSALMLADDEQERSGQGPRPQTAAPSRAASETSDRSTPLEQQNRHDVPDPLASNLDGLGRTLSWSPDDFGQARMAALGWLLSFEQQDKAPIPQPAHRNPHCAEKSPADVRALWDWFYLCQMRSTMRRFSRRRRKLSRAARADPLALWAYLHTMGGRHLPLGQEFFSHRRQVP